MSAITRRKSQKNVPKNGHDKMSLQIVTANQSIIICISCVFIYFLHGIMCKGPRNAVYLDLMKAVTLLSHFCNLVG